MAQSYEKQSRLRKLTYFALIVALFTVSLILRRGGTLAFGAVRLGGLEQEAQRLELRELSKGEVELTSSAVRLTLTGSRGLAVTALWMTAMKKKENHQWNELELVLDSITTLQPYFAKAWLFLSWDLAFNVAVECDRPRDKYYYVSRGVDLLAKGERQNRNPGNPDMRHHVGYSYHMKMGVSDEKTTMRCLLDLSCIDPVDRDPSKFFTAGARGQQINMDMFRDFCRANPRLVRRLREQLLYDTPDMILNFLADNQDVPHRFGTKKNFDGKSLPKEPTTQQFPILPPQQQDWPNPELIDFGLKDEPMDVYLLCRTWWQYAQLPLPPAHHNPGLELLGLNLPGIDAPQFDRVRHRLPRMTTMIFRTYPAQGQVYIASMLQEEGWFDKEGWTVPAWFGGKEEVLGAGPKHDSGRAWERAYTLFREYGLVNGMLITPAKRAELEARAKEFRDAMGIRPGDNIFLPPDKRDDSRLIAGLEASEKLRFHDYYSTVTNYPARLAETDAERDPDTRVGRKWFFQAERLRKFEQATEEALALYEKAVPLWMELMLKYPGWRRQDVLQEDTCELELKYVRHWRNERIGLLRPLVFGMIQFADPLHLPVELYTTDTQRKQNIPILAFRGPLSQVLVFEALPETHELAVKDFLVRWPQGANAALGQGLVPPPLAVYPGQAIRMLTKVTSEEPTEFFPWRFLIRPDIARQVRDRLGINPRPPETPPPTDPAELGPAPLPRGASR